jgi:hypothetical protein
MRSTDDRNFSDFHQAKFEARDIHDQRELIERNLTKLPGRVPFVRC